MKELLGGHPSVSVHSKDFHQFHHNLVRFRGTTHRPEHYRLTGADVSTALRNEYEQAINTALEQTQRDQFVLKISTLSQQVDYIRTLFPKARFIQMVRDARDVICSMEDLRGALEKAHQQPRALGPAADPLSLWSHQNTNHPHVNGAAAWFYHVTRSWLDLCWTMPDDYLRIRYEDLLDSPIMTLEKVAAFLKLEFPPELHHHLSKIKNEPTPIHSLGYSTCQAPGQKTGRYKSELSENTRIAIAPLIELPMALLGYKPDRPGSNSELEAACRNLNISEKNWRTRVEQETAYFQSHRSCFNPTRLFRQPSRPQNNDTPLLIDTVVTATRALQRDNEAIAHTSYVYKQDRHFEFPDDKIQWPHLAPLLNGKHTVGELKEKFDMDTDIDHLLKCLHQRGFIGYSNDR